MEKHIFLYQRDRAFDHEQAWGRESRKKYVRQAMSRPLRLEFPNTLYHVTSHWDRRENINEDDDDRLSFLEIPGTVVVD